VFFIADEWKVKQPIEGQTYIRAYGLVIALLELGDGLSTLYDSIGSQQAAVQKTQSYTQDMANISVSESMARSVDFHVKRTFLG